MMPESRPRRLRLALLLAPLAAPIALWALARALAVAARRGANDPPASLPAVLVLLFAFCVFGAPIAYAATLVVVWPLSRLLGRRAIRWWPLTIASALAGGALLPIYLRMLTPRGHWNFFPGTGFVAGAATGWAFWWFAAPGVGDAPTDPEVAPGGPLTTNTEP